MSWALWFIGLWPIIENYSLAGIAVVALLAFAWYSPVFKKTALAGAAVIVGCIIAFSAGIRLEGDRVREQWRESMRLEKVHGEQARSDAERTIARDTPDSVRKDRHNRDNWGTGSSARPGGAVRGMARP